MTLAASAASGMPAPSPEPVIRRLDYQPPYDWDAIIGFLAFRAIPGVETVTGDRYARTLAIGEHLGTLAVAPAGGCSLEVEVRFPDPAALPRILARVQRLFDLGADPTLVGPHLARDPALAPLVAARPGLRVPGAWDGFELAVRAILGQQITVVAARKLAGKLAAAYGRPLPPAWRTEDLTLAFPEPERLAGADIAALGMPGSRGRALSRLADAAAADPALFDRRPSLEEGVAALKALPGIGEWTAQYIAMRELREPDAFPAADVGLMRALAGPDGVRPTPAELLARAEAWRPWRAYAALHLWTGDAGSIATAKA